MIQIPVDQIERLISHVIIAGWTGRNDEAITAHINELALLGVAPPSRTPLFYQVDSHSLCNSDNINVLGSATSGEVEPVLFFDGNQMHLGVGSDHTDRDLEVTSVAHSKAICPKPISEYFWPLDSVIDRLDHLELRSSIRETNDDHERVYQQGSLSQIKPLMELIKIARMENAIQEQEPFLMFCGTIPVCDEVVFAKHVCVSIFDPVTNASIEHRYQVTQLDVVK